MRILKRLVWSIIRLAHRPTFLLDRWKLKQNLQLQWPPVFIIGVPRSGTTLLYQVLVDTLKCAYIPNIANWFYMCPITATQFGLKFCSEYRSSYTSKYGFEEGCMAPSESGNIWNRWFPHEKREGFNYTPAGYLGEEAKNQICKMVTNIQHLYGQPFITKNGKVSVRIPAICEIFPDAIFVEIQRDLIDSATSILVRQKRFNESWWSVMPKEVNDFRNDHVLERICKQVYFIRQNIENDIKTYAPNRFYFLKYDSLCENPSEEIDKIRHYLESKGCEVDRKTNEISLSFHKSNSLVNDWVKPEEIVVIKKMMSRLYEIN